ncbi:MAG: adenine deaminase [Chloroflexi bacterium]|nr:adenine deaminase [Chloroflexota bacterium]
MDAKQHSKMTRNLVDVAMGRSPADCVIRGGKWVSVQSGEIVEHIDIAILGERIAYVGADAGHTIGAETKIVQAENRYLVPGLLDGHMHVESGMITVTEVVRAVLPHGTTGIFIDPHEIANVLGMDGVKMMVDEAHDQPIHVWVQVPSCVPSAPGLETAGAEIGPEDVARALTWPGIIGLGEMMNFPGVYSGDEWLHAEMAETWQAGKVIGGHYASSDLGIPFHGYIAGGAQDDHEGTRLQDAVARVRQGMKVMMRDGSAWKDVDQQIRAVTELGLDPRHFILVTDDSHAGTLVNEGHINRVVKHAISLGTEPIVAIQMATLNPAEHFGVARDVGQIAPGRYADILLVRDLENLSIETVFAKGTLTAQDGELTIDLPAYDFPPSAKNSVKLERELNARDFVIEAQSSAEGIVNVIGVVEYQAATQHLQIKMMPENGEYKADNTRDLAKVALVERHHKTGEVRLGFVQGFGFTAPCAVGSTVAHDAHHMLIVGTDDANMAQVAGELQRVGGGQTIVLNGKTIAMLELPIAGLMSDERADVVAEKTENLLQGFRLCGCKLNSPNMQLSLLSLVVIPALRISDKGLVDVEKFELIPLVE